MIPVDVYHSILCHLCDGNVRASLCVGGEREGGGGVELLRFSGCYQ